VVRKAEVRDDETISDNEEIVGKSAGEDNDMIGVVNRGGPKLVGFSLTAKL